MDIMQELDRVGAVMLYRHFVYTSGKHGSGYINMDPLFADPQFVMWLGTQLIEPYFDEGFDTVAAPATGGILLAFTTALAYKYKKVWAIWADKNGDDFVFERASFAGHLRNKRVLVVEDLLTTGDSVRKVCRQVGTLGGHIVGVSAVCNRGGVTAQNLGVKHLASLASVSFEAFNADVCPLCVQNVPIVVDIGHGAAYAELHPYYPGGYVRLTA